jgi:hypothetical protein
MLIVCHLYQDAVLPCFLFPNYQLNALSLMSLEVCSAKVCCVQLSVYHKTSKMIHYFLLKRCCFSEISKQGSAKSQMRSSDKIVYKFSDEKIVLTPL